MIENEHQTIATLLQELTVLKKAFNEISLVYMTDVDGNITYVNDAFCNVSKYSREELIGQNHRIIKSEFHSPQFYKSIWDTITKGKIWRGTIKNTAKDGSAYWGKTVILPTYNSKNKIIKYISMTTDITEQKNLLNELELINKGLTDREKLLRVQMNESIHRYSLEKKLIESNAELVSEKKFAIQKDEFATMVSHELKTPLFPIMMHCQMLKDPEMLGTLTLEQINAVNEIEKMVNQLDSLTGDILDAQKLDMNHMKFIKTKFKLCEFFDEIKKNADFGTDDKNISIIISADDLEIYTDRNRLSQVFSNLIQNAVNFVSNDAGKIQISAIDQDGNILFCVKDNGVGIQSDKISHLFRKFYQVDTTLKRKHSGTGLGLAICKGIVEGLGGKIWVDSKLGQGSAFYFSVPKYTPHDCVFGPRNPSLETDDK